MRTRTPRRLRLLLIWVLLELLAAAQVHGPDGSTVLVSWVRELVQPIDLVAGAFFESGETLREEIRSRQRLVEENLQLNQENQALRLSLLISRNNAQALIQAEESLRQLPQLGGIPARVISRSSGMLRLRVGVEQQAHVDDPVLSAVGVLGRVRRVEGRKIWVEELGNPSAAIGVQSKTGTVQGLARGLGGAELSLLYIPQHADISISQVLLSSGSDGIYPPGLPVARVLSISESRSPFLSVRAQSLAAVADLRAVRILSFTEIPEDG